jgi:hypothetical protein
MSRSVRLAVLGALLLGGLAPWVRDAGAQAGDDAAVAPPLPVLTFFDGADWVQLDRHACWVEGAGATVAGTATATFKAKLDGPKTYVVIAGTTSQVTLANPKPRFRVAADRAGALRIQLAQFEVKDENRRTTIEHGKSGTLFTKGVDLEVTKIAEGLYELKPTKSLEPGEYALGTSDTDPVADFTIIEKGY